MLPFVVSWVLAVAPGPARAESRPEGPPLPPATSALIGERPTEIVKRARGPGLDGRASQHQTALDRTNDLFAPNRTKAGRQLALRASLSAVGLGLGIGAGTRPTGWPNAIPYPGPASGPAVVGVALVALAGVVVSAIVDGLARGPGGRWRA